jgi:hypothetical protein
MYKNKINIPFIKNDKIIDSIIYEPIYDYDFKYLYEYINKRHKTDIFIDDHTPVLYQRITEPVNKEFLSYNMYNKYKIIYSRTIGIDNLINNAFEFKSNNKVFYGSYLIIDILNILRPNLKHIYSQITKNNLSYSDARDELSVIKDGIKKCLNIVHSNILLFDLENNIVERFEPHGHGEEIEIDEFDAILNRELYKNNFRYVRPIDYCPKLSFQSILSTSDDPVYRDLGFCTIWNLFYINCRILNPTISREILSKRILTYFRRRYGSKSEKMMYITIYNYYAILTLYIKNRKSGIEPEWLFNMFMKLGYIKDVNIIDKPIITLLAGLF